jgi:hypothetical protein
MVLPRHLSTLYEGKRNVEKFGTPSFLVMAAFSVRLRGKAYVLNSCGNHG